MGIICCYYHWIITILLRLVLLVMLLAFNCLYILIVIRFIILPNSCDNITERVFIIIALLPILLFILLIQGLIEFQAQLVVIASFGTTINYYQLANNGPVF